MPTPTPAARATGSRSAGATLAAPNGTIASRGDEHREREAVDAPDRRAARQAVREDDVEGEQPGVDERQGEADRLGSEADVDEHVHAGNREREREPVSKRADAERRKDDHRQELDRCDRPQREPVDCEVEARVHHREDEPERDEEPERRPVEPWKRPPWPSPDGEHDRRAHDAEPGDAEWLDPHEQEHGERRAEVVEHRASDEEGRRRSPGEPRHDHRFARRASGEEGMS